MLRKVAANSDGVGGSKHACIIIHGNRILTKGWNCAYTHPIAVRFNGEEKPYLHAEMMAISRLIRHFPPKTIKKCTLVVARFDDTGKLMISKPCEGCKKTLSHFGIKKVYWSENQDELK